MAPERRYTTYFCLSLVLTLQCATPSLALPALDPAQSYNRQGSCVTVHASPAVVQPTPTHISKLLGDRQLQDLLLPLPVEETDPRVEVEGALTEEDGGKRASSVLCRGQWPHSSSAPNALLTFGASDVLDFTTARSGGHRKALYLLLSRETLSELSERGNTTLDLTCSNSIRLCFNILYKKTQPMESGVHRLLRRSASRSSDNSPTVSHATPVTAVVVVVVSLVVLISLVALCAGSNAYDPQQTGGGAVKLEKSPSEAPPTEVTVQFNPPQPVQVEIETRAEPATNGAVRDDVAVAKEDKKSSPKHNDSIGPPSSSQGEESERESRSRTLSARSFDPLPEIPKLDTVEDEKGQRSSKSPSSPGDEDDEAGYAYARVGGAVVGGMDEADSDKEEDKPSGEAGQRSELPPYGKVSHHVTKAKVVETEEYAEVKEVFRGPQAVKASRGRSSTDPIDPAEAKSDNVREKRALTHTQMMPLPDVPKQPMGVEENEMYDSIPEDMRTSQVPLPQVTAATPKSKPRERLYESMDEVDEVEDTYESVPDNLKPDSPLPLTPVSPTHSPNKLPLLVTSTSPPLPPSSPVPKPQPKEQGEKEKKPVEKTLSASQTEGDGKRRFSFFGRKKTASVSAASKKEKKEKEKHGEKDHKEHHVPHQPLPDVPASPVTSPPLPPIPVNDDDDDTMYDTPQLDFMAGPVRSSPGPSPISPSDAKAKSQSLPSSARGAGSAVFHGPRVNIPLPRVPEDSGQGMVVRERVLESPLRGKEEEKPYDRVKIPLDMDGEEPYDTVKVPNELEELIEPNYDTVDKEEILKALAESENMANEPGYDSVMKLEGQENEGQRERDRAPTPQTNEEEGTGIKYGKVTRPLSPELDDTPGILPEHDEEGYAVVPEDFKMRKRAWSASQGVKSQVKTESPEPTAVKTPFDEREETTSPGEPSEAYATVDIIAKKRSKADKKEDSLATEGDSSRQRSVSPVPPPLPPVGDIGEVMGDYSQPPIPVQSEDVLELVSPRASSSLKPPGSDEPPYAKVKSKDHPYAELDLGVGGEQARLAAQENTDDEAGYDKVRTDNNKTADPKDKALGYDTVTDPEVKQEVVEGDYNTVGDPLTTNEQTAVYDTLVDSDKVGAEEPTSRVEQETPKLVPAEPQQQLYDSLEPAEKEKDGQGEAGNLYDSLEPEPLEQLQNGVSAEELEEERYEEIDDERRMELIAKQKQWSDKSS